MLPRGVQLALGAGRAGAGGNPMRSPPLSHGDESPGDRWPLWLTGLLQRSCTRSAEARPPRGHAGGSAASSGVAHGKGWARRGGVLGFHIVVDITLLELRTAPATGNPRAANSAAHSHFSSSRATVHQRQAGVRCSGVGQSIPGRKPRASAGVSKWPSSFIWCIPSSTRGMAVDSFFVV